jgi:hypothetical protein
MNGSWWFLFKSQVDDFSEPRIKLEPKSKTGCIISARVKRPHHYHDKRSWCRLFSVTESLWPSSSARRTEVKMINGQVGKYKEYLYKILFLCVFRAITSKVDQMKVWCRYVSNFLHCLLIESLNLLDYAAEEVHISGLLCESRVDLERKKPFFPSMPAMHSLLPRDRMSVASFPLWWKNWLLDSLKESEMCCLHPSMPKIKSHGKKS